MTRKEWLETFINLADGGAKCVEYRRKLRIKAQNLPTYIKSLGGFRRELGAIKEKEKAAIVKAEYERKKREAKNKAIEKKVVSKNLPRGKKIKATEEILEALDKAPKPPEDDGVDYSEYYNEY